MTTSRGGQPYKDQMLQDGFNPDKEGITKGVKTEAERQANAERRRLASQANMRKAREAAWRKRHPEATTDLYNETSKPPASKPLFDSNTDADDLKSAYQMLQDMRWVYRSLNGREKLKKLVKGDDKQFVFMVKELMKIEAALMAAKIRKEGEGAGLGGGQQNFFVVLKGLPSDRPMLDAIEKSQRAAIELRRRVGGEQSPGNGEDKDGTSQYDQHPPEQLQRAGIA